MVILINSDEIFMNFSIFFSSIFYLLIELLIILISSLSCFTSRKKKRIYSTISYYKNISVLNVKKKWISGVLSNKYVYLYIGTYVLLLTNTEKKNYFVKWVFQVVATNVLWKVSFKRQQCGNYHTSKRKS